MKDASLTASNPAAAASKYGVSPAQVFRVWLHVAALSFCGPAVQNAVMHRMIVDEKKSVGESRFFHALSYCMATGWRPPCRPT
jgi:chromate transporter